MKNGQYVFQYKIGVFYKEYKWAENLLNEYIKNIPKECIDHYTKDRLVLKNNSCIDLIPSTSQCRGRRYDKVIIQEEIEEEIIDCIIRPVMLNELIIIPKDI